MFARALNSNSVPESVALSHFPSVGLEKTLTRNRNPVFIGRMKTKTIGLTLAFCFLTAGA
jgi:hypothetical protein